MNIKVLLLIDGDSLVYHSLRDDIRESLNIIDDKIYNIFEQTEGTHYVIFISQGKYFRHNLFPEYKISREKYRNNPSSKWVKVLKQYLIANWNAQWMDNVEADDLVAYWYNKEIYSFQYNESVEEVKTSIYYNDGVESSIPKQIFEKTICSPDKDLLQSIPGKHFNYSYKLENKEYSNSVVKGWWVETNKVNANKFIWKQMICGDTADGIIGLLGKGEAYFDKITKSGISNSWPLFILNEYLEFYKNPTKAIYEYQKNYRLLHLLENDEDFIREIGELPKFPKIIKIPIKQQEIIEIKNEF